MRFAIDVETTGLTWQSRPYMLSVYDGVAGCVLDLRDKDQRETASRLLSVMTVAVGANTWFDLRMLVCSGILSYRQVERMRVRDVLRDSYSVTGKWVGLKVLAKDVLGIKPEARDEVLEAMRLRRKRCSLVYALTHGFEIWDITAKYCQLDSIMAWNLAEVLPESDTTADKLTLLQTLHGVRVDVERAKRQAATLWLSANEASVKHGACITSPLQIAAKLGIRNADKKALAGRTDDLSVDVLRYREYSKLAEMLEGVVTAQENGYVHPLLSWACVTGRASCSKPNLQNFHNHPVNDIVMREVILADSDGASVVSADFSGIELVLYANATDSEKILTWMRNGEDTHNHLTEMVFGGERAFESVVRSANGKRTDEEVRAVLEACANSVVSAEAQLKCKRSRNINKRLMFGTIYGASVDKIAEIVGIRVSEARELFRTLCHTLPELPAAKRFWSNYVSRHGNVTNMCDRVVGCSKPHAGLNTLIQSSAADIMRAALVDVDRRMKEEKLGRTMFTVHDEVVTSVTKKGANKAAGELIAETMTAAATRLVGFVIKAEATDHGERWGLK